MQLIRTIAGQHNNLDIHAYKQSCNELTSAVTSPQVVLVTGSSTGIGKSIVLQFAQSRDFRVYATMRNPAAWDIEPRDNIIVKKLDVTSDIDVDMVMKEVLKAEGRVDILINNAGYALAGCLENVYINEAKAMFEVNVWGVVRMLQAVLPSMRRRRSGYIINISSTAGIRGFAGGEYYVGSKHALEGIMDSMRYSLAAYNISVTNMNAGPVRTPLGEKLLAAEGFGSRVVEDGDDDSYITDTAIDMQQRLGGLIRDHAPSSEDLAKIVTNLVHLKQQAKTITDIPFNVGNAEYSQSLLERIRVHPTGWGGPYTESLRMMKPLPSTYHGELKAEL